MSAERSVHYQVI